MHYFLSVKWKPNVLSAKCHAWVAFSETRVIKIGNAIRQPYFITINSSSRDSFSDMPYTGWHSKLLNTYFNETRAIVWRTYIFARPKCCSQYKSEIDVLRRLSAFQFAPYSRGNARSRCFGQLQLHSIMIMTETRAHNSAYLHASCLVSGIIRHRTGLMMTDGSRPIRYVPWREGRGRR